MTDKDITWYRHNNAACAVAGLPDSMQAATALVANPLP